MSTWLEALGLAPKAKTKKLEAAVWNTVKDIPKALVDEVVSNAASILAEEALQEDKVLSTLPGGTTEEKVLNYVTLVAATTKKDSAEATASHCLKEALQSARVYPEMTSTQRSNHPKLRPLRNNLTNSS